jgi:ABC-2 type transport system ATP-binding protein
MTTPAVAVSTDGLTKRFAGRVVVSELSMEIPTGVTAGFIGPNGAGKTTTMAMLLGLVRPSAGRAAVLGHSIEKPASYLGRVGALVEGPALWPALTGIENLRALARLGGHDEGGIPEVLAIVGLDDRGGDRYGTYSFGMKQRLAIAAALLGEPELLVLDEPTNGLDPVGIAEMRELISAVGSGRRTVLVSSHILAELEAICDWLVVIERGRLLYGGAAQGFMTETAEVVLSPAKPSALAAVLRIAASEGYEAERDGENVVVAVEASRARQAAAALNQAAAAAGVGLAEVHVRRASLEDHYLKVVAGAGR